MNSHYLKLLGKAELPQAIEIGHNFKVLLEGSITAVTKTDNDDGSHTYSYKFNPVLVETINDKGERIRAKDTRSRSQQLRSLLFKRWRSEDSSEEFETWYDKEMTRIIISEGEKII